LSGALQTDEGYRVKCIYNLLSITEFVPPLSSSTAFSIYKCRWFLLAWWCAPVLQVKYTLAGSLTSYLIIFSKVKHSLVLEYGIIARLFPFLFCLNTVFHIKKKKKVPLLVC